MHTVTHVTCRFLYCDIRTLFPTDSVCRRNLFSAVQLMKILYTFLFLVRLSLLTMTNPNQLCDVLYFVCSKMADETNLSSKVPVADRTREV